MAAATAAAANAAIGPFPSCSSPLGERLPRIASAASAFGDTRKANTTIERVLGATRNAVDELSAHENDAYYLSTSYGNTGPNGAGGSIDSWDCWHPNGNPKSNGEAYMNCTGFVVAVLEACGADCDQIGSYVGSAGYNRGNKSNLYRWIMYLEDHANLCSRYESKEALLEGGQLKKGDLIIANPRDWSVPDVDCHIMFFWGSTPDHDCAWHSSGHGDDIIAGTCPGNMISKITSKSSDVYWLHAPLENIVKLTFEKRSAQLAVATGSEGAPFYSLSGARFGIYRTCDDGICSDLIAEFTTDEAGLAEVELPSSQTLWIHEEEAPLGFCAWESPLRIDTGSENQSKVLNDEPQCVRVVVEKSDAETGNIAQGHASLEGAVFELADSKGNSYTAKTEWSAERACWIAEFPEIARGSIRLREACAPTGYLKTPLEGSDSDGWAKIELSGEQSVRCSITAISSREDVIRGDIEGAKFYVPEGLEESSLKTPLEGAEFTIWLQDDGTLSEKGYSVSPITGIDGEALKKPSGETAFGSCIGTIRTHSDGHFSSKDLLASWIPEEHNGLAAPECALIYGSYALVETFCPDQSLRLADPLFDIEIQSDGSSVFFIIEDRPVHSPVRIRKIDAETGKTVLAAGTEIELLRKTGANDWRLVEFSLRTPDNATVSRFSIPESGIVQFPDVLPWGSYAVRETHAVAPYLVRNDPVYFNVEEHHDWNENDIIEIELPNRQAKGRIVGTKIDTESGEGVAGGVFAAYAGGDIVLPEGTVVFREGDFVGEAKSDETGEWRIEGLSLGSGIASYIVSETYAPEGYVLDERRYRVTLTWENDTCEIVDCAMEVREQPTKICLTKVDSESGIGIEGVVFSLEALSEPESPRSADDATENEPEEEASKIVELVTNENGIAEASHLKRETTYRIKETKAREDLGYIGCEETFERFLGADGRWHESRQAYEDAQKNGTWADQLWELEIANQFSSVEFYKVDHDAWQAAQIEDEFEARKAAASDALTGGTFVLQDEDGTLVAPSTKGLEASGWQAQGKSGVRFDHLSIGKTYTFIEKSAPDGYRMSTEGIALTIEHTSTPAIVVFPNEKAERLAKTNDRTPLIAGAAGLVFAGGIAAMAAYSQRRSELEGK